MRTVGIIGGFGPEATANFQMKVVELCRTQNHLLRPPLLIWNCPIPLKIEADLLLKSQGSRKFLPFLIDAARRLEQAKAELIVLPCNTLHIFIDEIRRSVDIPILSIIEETAAFLRNQDISTVGVFATKLTILHNLHNNALRKMNIRPIFPSPKDQAKIDHLINAINRHDERGTTNRIFSTVSNKFINRGIRHFLLACTDLHIVFPRLADVTIHDTLDILAKAAVREIFKRI